MPTGLDTQQRIFAANPDDRRAFEALEEHFFLDGDWDALVRIYRARLDAPSIASDDDQRAPLLFRLGQLLEERVLDLDAAAEVYWTLARLDPSNRPTLRQLRGIHTRRGQWDMVLQIAELEGATAMPPYERAAFEAELGHTWHRHLGDADEAQRAYERALEVVPDHPEALEGLAEIHREAGRIEEAASILERLTDRLRGPERAPIWIALGRLLAGPLDEPERARRCFQAALEDDPFQAAAVEWSLLLATVAEDWAAVSELLESRFDIASGARHRAAIAVEASQIQLNHLASPARARAWLDRAVELAPEEPSVLLAACAVERADGDREALLHTLERLAELGGELTSRSVLIEAAGLHADFGDAEAALAALRRADVGRAGDDEAVLTMHARLLRELGEKRELAEVLETLCALEPAEGAVALRAEQLRELARLQEEDLGDEAAALASWRRAFSLEPGEGEALAALERHFRKHDDHAALREVFEAAIDGSGTTSAALHAKLGTLLASHFQDAEAARAGLETALELDPACRPALSGLRRLAEQQDDPDLMLAVCEREAADLDDPERLAELSRCALPILETREAWADALTWAVRWSDAVAGDCEALAKRAELEERLERPDEQVESLRRLAGLQQGLERSRTLEREAAVHATLDDPLAAATALELALEARPDSVDLLEALCTALRRLDRPRELTRALRQLVELLPPGEQRAPLEELAETLQTVLGDVDTAIVVRWRLVDLPDADDASVEALEGLLEQAGRHAELAQLLDTRRQRLADDDPEAFALDLRRAEVLLDDLGHCDEAAELLGHLLDRHPEHDEIPVRLERALRAGDDAAGLCALLARRIEWSDSPEERGALQLERAQILEEILGETAEACALYEGLADAPPTEAIGSTATARLEALLETAGEWDRLRDRLDARAASLPESEEAGLRERLARLCRDRLHDVPACAAQLERVAELCPDRLHVWQQLEEIYAREIDRPSDWLRVAEAELAGDPRPERAFSLRVGAARLCLDDERRPAGTACAEAYGHYEAVLELDPAHGEAAEVLAQHYASTARPEEAARVLEMRLASFASDAAHDEEATELRERLAALYAGPLEDDARARPLLEAALEARGADPGIAAPLAALYERGSDWTALGQLARQVLESFDREDPSQTPAEGELAWRLRLGRSARALDRLDEAALAYRAALELAPADVEIEDALISIYEDLEEIEPLIELLERRLGRATGADALALRLRLARHHQAGHGEPAEALRHLDAVLEAAPTHPGALEQALETAEALDEPERLLAILERALASPIDDARRASLLERRAPLLADVLDRPEHAIQSYRELLVLVPDHAAGRRALRQQLERLERWPALLDRLFVEARDATGERRLELLEEATRLAGDRLGPDASLPWLARMRALRPEDPTLLARIAEVHRRAGRFEAALRAIDEQLALLADPVERCALELDRARLLERELHAPGRAVQAYRRALAPASPEQRSRILVELERLYTDLGRPVERAEILEAQIADQPPEETEALRQTLATIYCAELARPERAIPHLEENLRRAIREPQREMDTLTALESALRAAGRVDDWIRTAERQLELLAASPPLDAQTPPEFKRYLREELVRAQDESLGDPDRALVHLRALCESRPEDPRQQRSLRDLLRRTGRRVELARALERHVEGEDARPEDWLELARLREEALHDLSGARAAYRAAAGAHDAEERSAPGRTAIRQGGDCSERLTAIRGRRRCSERLQDWADVAAALELEIEQDEGLARSERAALARRLGALRWQRLGDAEGAIRGYELAREIAPDDLVALGAQRDVEAARGDRAAVIALLRRELAILDEDAAARRREVWLELAALLEEEDAGRPEAVEALRAADAIEPLAAVDLLRLARLLQAIGDVAGFCERFGRWCDRADAEAGPDDHLELARALAGQDELEAARARTARATAVAPESCNAWALAGELAREAGEPKEAAKAFERAARHAPPGRIASLCLDAAACIEPEDAERAHELVARALEHDAASLPAQLAMTRLASALGHAEQTVDSAERAIELAESEPIDAADRLEAALAGGRAARTLERAEASRRLFTAVLEVEPDHAEALEAVAEVDWADGDRRAARTHLERRLEIEGPNPDRALQIARVARALEDEEHLDAAWTRYAEAIDADPSLDEAHEGLVRVHERAARLEEALAALEAWIEHTGDDAIRGRAAFRAAEHAVAFEQHDRALEWLALATEQAADLASAWALRVELMDRQGCDPETRTLCDAALEAIEPGPEAARIALRAARLAEVAGDPERARSRYAEAAGWDPRATEAALGESRLARLAGDWRAADDALSRFLSAHPDPESTTLAHVHLERGRLLSGPLEDFDRAVTAYEQALARQPELGVARTALARLLTLRPDRWREALALHREILSGDPTNPESLRAVARIAEQRDQHGLAGTTLLVLRALGEASPEEEEAAPTQLGFPIHPGPPMSDDEAERLRRLAHQANAELAGVLAGAPPRPTHSDAAVDAAIETITTIEDELSAPGLMRLPCDERAGFFSSFVALFLEPGGNGRDSGFREPLEEALGRWTRRKVRRIVEETTLESLEGVDHAAWGDELRAMAAAQAIDRSGGELRSVIRALLALDGTGGNEPSFEGARLATLAADCEPVRRLLGRITTLVCDRLTGNR